MSELMPNMTEVTRPVLRGLFGSYGTDAPFFQEVRRQRELAMPLAIVLHTTENPARARYVVKSTFDDPMRVRFYNDGEDSLGDDADQATVLVVEKNLLLEGTLDALKAFGALTKTVKDPRGSRTVIMLDELQDTAFMSTFSVEIPPIKGHL